MELPKLPQQARAEAAEIHLKPLEHYMVSSGIDLHRIEVPPNASFWKEYEYVFDLDGVDQSLRTGIHRFYSKTVSPKIDI